MFDENLNLEKDTTTTYSKDNLETLIDRIQRIENKDITIISLPRHDNSINADNIQFISKQVESFLNLNSINIDTATIWEIEEIVSITIDLKNERELEIKKNW